MAQPQTLVPNLPLRFAVILAALVVATMGLFERRTRFVLEDGTVLTGKVVEEESTEDLLAIERPSGSVVKIPRERIREQDWFHFDVDINLGLDLKGGTVLRYRLDLDDVPEDKRQEILERTVEVYKERLDSLGVKELSIRPAGSDEIIIELPGVTMEESDAYESVVMNLGRLEFRIVAEDVPGVLDIEKERQRLRDYLRQLEEKGESWTPYSIDLTQFDVKGPDGKIYRWFPYSERAIEGGDVPDPSLPFIMLELDDREVFTGEDLADTYVTQDQAGRPALGFEMKPSRADDFGDFTEKYKGRRMAIVLDGKVDSAPRLEDRIERHGVIHGGGAGFTPEEVKQLRTVLSSGSLQVKPERLSKSSIGPTLGQAAIQRGIVAGIVAGTGVILFMLFFYGKIGVISCIALLIGLYLLIGGLGFLEATLTLPGIAGILLTVGMAVDQNILINERMREEREKGKTRTQSIKNGFERAFLTILDAQLTTFLAGFVLYSFGTGPIRGFAVTLMLGIVTTMFAAIYGSKTVFALCIARDWLKDLRIRRLVGETNIAFTRYLKPCLAVSFLTIVGGMSVFAYDYENLKGLDFAGGFQAVVRFREPQEAEQIRRELAERYRNVQVVEMIGVGGERRTTFRITIRATGEEESRGGDARDRYLEDLREVFADRMLPDPITDIQIRRDEERGRTDASFVLHFTAPIDPEVVRSRLRDRFAVHSVEPLDGEGAARSIRVEASTTAPLEQDRLRALVSTALMELPGGVRLSDPIPESEFIGSRVGKELTNSAIKAIVVAILLILVYIRIRFFDFNWGLAACTALVHDVLFGLGAVAFVHFTGLVNIELDLTMIGAFLTIVGYSLNDTIVIFDRVRENLPRMKAPFAEIVNVSINQTLSRTLLTSLTTLIAVAVLFSFNLGQRNVLEGFAFVILVGVVVGTYSTVFIASPLLVWLTARKARKTGRAVRYGDVPVTV